MKNLMNYVFYIFATLSIEPASAAISCDSRSGIACDFHVNEAGDLISSGGTVARGVGNVGMMADVSIYRYGDQHVLVRESSANDHAIIAIPITEIGSQIGFKSVYSISIDLIASSNRQRVVWRSRRVAEKFHQFERDIWDVSGKLLNDASMNHTNLSGFPATEISISTQKTEKSDRCFVPFRKDDDNFPIEFIACRALSSPVSDGEMEFSGIIGHGAMIDMRISKQGSRLIGKYRYLKQQGGWIGLHGEITQRGEVRIKELDEKTGEIAASFSGSVKGGKILGSWSSNDGKKLLPFVLYKQGFVTD